MVHVESQRTFFSSSLRMFNSPPHGALIVPLIASSRSECGASPVQASPLLLPLQLPNRFALPPHVSSPGLTDDPATPATPGLLRRLPSRARIRNVRFNPNEIRA